MAALAEDGKQSGGRLAAVLQEESQAVGWCSVVRGHGVPAVVILDQQSEQPHESGLVLGSGTSLANQFSEAAADLLVLFLGLDNLWNSLDQKLFTKLAATTSNRPAASNGNRAETAESEPRRPVGKPVEV